MTSGAFSRRAFLAGLAGSSLAHALDRRPYGGVLRLALPLSLDGIDPHAADHAASALFSAAIADPLFAWDPRGRPYPALAAALPTRVGSALRITLRPDLVTARGKPLDGRDVIASLERARRGAARPLLVPFGPPRAVRGEPLAVDIGGDDVDALSFALASPVTAIVPGRFNPVEPDGTGAFRATRGPSGFVLERNERAARGPAFLDRIEIRRALDLAAPLRAFETGELDVGFLGAGLHQKRKGSEPLSTPPAGFVVLRTGIEAKTWGAPGIAARLVEGIPADRFTHLGMSLPGGASTGGASTGGWGGAPADLLVDEGSAYLVEIARVVASELSRPGHEIRPLPLPLAEHRKRVGTGTFTLAIDFVRSLGPTPRHTLLALLHAGNPRLAERPPALTTVEPHALSRTLPLAVLGELSVRGAASGAFRGLADWDLGAVWKTG